MGDISLPGNLSYQRYANSYQVHSVGNVQIDGGQDKPDFIGIDNSSNYCMSLVSYSHNILSYLLSR